VGKSEAPHDVSNQGGSVVGLLDLLDVGGQLKLEQLAVLRLVDHFCRFKLAVTTIILVSLSSPML
jgi:hypothetical protein